MKMFHRLLAALLSVMVITGISSPVETEAATRVTSVKFDSFEDVWHSNNSKYVWVSVGTKGSGTTTKYQYRVYVNGKVVKRGYSDVYKEAGNSKRFCKVYIPSNSFFTVRVRAKRGGVWSGWSGHTAIGPDLKNFNFHSVKGNTITFTWKKMAGVTDYAVYRLKGATWKRIKTVSASSTSVTINMDNWPHNDSYTVEVRPRKKVNGKYVDGKGNDYLWVQWDLDGEIIFTH